MRERPELPTERRLLNEVREDLAAEFVRVARAERPRRNRWFLFGAVVGFALVPGSFAAAKLLETEHSIVVDLHPDGNVTRVDGEIIDCPADPELVAELELDPCAALTPAPAPLDAHSPGGASRADPRAQDRADPAAQDLLQELDESGE